MSDGMKVLMIVGCALYVVCPLDFDFIPFFGWIDDAIVVYLTYRKLQADKAAKSRDFVVEAKVVDRKG